MVFGHLIASAKDEDELSRLRLIIDYEGGRQLWTPRSVVRALDAVRFLWPPLREAEADLSDLVWIQLIKNGNSALYRWIEEYCGTAAALSLGTAQVEEAEKASCSQQCLAVTSMILRIDTFLQSSFLASNWIIPKAETT
jgi:hypothetical protein